MAIPNPRLITDTPIEVVVLRVFIRTCKENGIYSNFWRRFPSLLLRGRNCHNREMSPHRTTPFDNATSIRQAADILRHLIQDDAAHNPPIPSVNEANLKLTLMVNHLVHFFIEDGEASLELCSRIGEEVYNTACIILYGEDYWRREDAACQKLMARYREREPVSESDQSEGTEGFEDFEDPEDFEDDYESIDWGSLERMPDFNEAFLSMLEQFRNERRNGENN